MSSPAPGPSPLLAQRETHEAFSLTPVFENAKFKVTAIESWGPRRVIVGCSDGCVRLYETDAKRQVFSKYIPENGVSDFPLSRKPIDQLVVGHVANNQYILVVLSDGLVQVFDLPSMELLQSLNQSKGAYLMVGCGGKTSPNRDTRLAQVPEVLVGGADGNPQRLGFPFCLCVAVKKRNLLLTMWDPKRGQLVVTKDLVVPDTIKDMYACPGSVCIGFRREYALVDLTTGGMQDIFTAGKKGNPVIAAFSETELVLGRDNDSIWVRWSDGQPTRREAGLVWSESPQALLFYHPYFIALMGNHLEIRNVLTKSLTQVLPFRGGKLLTRGPGLFVASSSGVYLINEVPFSRQMNELVKASLFSEILSLVQSSHDQQWASPQERAKALRDIHTLYAYNLFNKGDYSKALYYFDEAGRSPEQILSLFPDVVPAALQQQAQAGGGGLGVVGFDHPQMVKELQGDESLRAIAALVPYLNRVRQRLARESDRRAQARAERQARRAQLLQRDPAAAAELDEESSSEDEDELAAAHQAHQLQQQSVTAGVLGGAVGGPGAARRMPLRVLVDTVLLKTYLMINVHMAMQMVKELNFCDIEESTNIICSYDRYGVLIQLLKTRGLHRRALQQLKLLGQSANQLHEFHGPRETIEYLKDLATGPQPCTEEETALVLEFSPWVLEAAPAEALQIFTVSLENYQRLQLEEQRRRQLEIAGELQGGSSPGSPAAGGSGGSGGQLRVDVPKEDSGAGAEYKYGGDESDSELGGGGPTGSSGGRSGSPRNIIAELEAEAEAERRAREQATKYGGLDPSLVLVHLKAHTSQALQCEYLECLINVAGETGMKFHNELVILYLNQLKEHIVREESKGNMSCGAGVVAEEPNQEFGRLRRGLLRMLSSSQHYQPEDKLSLLPRNKLLEERAVLLSRLNRHEEALTIYAHVLKKPQMAMEYCDRLYDEDHPELKQIYLLLVKVHVKPDPSLDPSGMLQGDVAPNTDAALQVMVSTHTRLDCAAALAMIPGEIALDKIMPFLQLVLSSTTHTRRTNQVVRHLLEAEHMTAKFECMQESSQPIHIDRSTVCPRCHKRLGNVAFARYPNGDVVHYMCHAGGGANAGFHSPHDPVGSYIGSVGSVGGVFDFDPASVGRQRQPTFSRQQPQASRRQASAGWNDYEQY